VIKTNIEESVYRLDHYLEIGWVGLEQSSSVVSH